MSYTSLTYHIVFATNQRRRWLTEDVADKLAGYMNGIFVNLGGRLLAAGAADDHMHLAGLLPPTSAVAEFIGKIKANSSRWLRRKRQDMGAFRWQDGYAAFSVSPSALARVKRYIHRQREHHHGQTFDEELAALFEKHGIKRDGSSCLA
ncbi:MAG: IS200/IS605 family transposase [Phycisphaerae bacterium]